MDGGFLTVIALALLPALGNFIGGLLAEWIRPSRRVINYALHGAAGIIIAVIAIEVMPSALINAPAWLLALAYLFGGGFSLLIGAGIEHWQKRQKDGAGSGAWMVYVAVAGDLIGDGLLIGAGSVVSSQLALFLALGQVIADVPEGFSTLANFRNRGVGRGTRLWLSASFVIPVVAAAIFSYVILRWQSEVIQVAALVFVAGLYSLAAVEDMLREAHESEEDTHWSAASFLAGFALFLLVSGELG